MFAMNWKFWINLNKWQKGFTRKILISQKKITGHAQLQQEAFGLHDNKNSVTVYYKFSYFILQRHQKFLLMLTWLKKLSIFLRTLLILSSTGRASTFPLSTASTPKCSTMRLCVNFFNPFPKSRKLTAEATPIKEISKIFSILSTSTAYQAAGRKFLTQPTPINWNFDTRERHEGVFHASHDHRDMRVEYRPRTSVSTTDLLHIVCCLFI